jgi:hypothetical protein
MKVLCEYIQQLLNYAAELIVLGRTNFERVNLQGEYIIVDETESNQKGRMLSYDPDTETEYYNIYQSSHCTISFYGNNAKRNAYRFSVLQNSQLSYDLQRDLDTAIYKCTTPRNIKTQDGTQWHDLWQVEIVCDYTTTEDVSTLRIDTPQLEFTEDL